jgi:hypothetical protein
MVKEKRAPEISDTRDVTRAPSPEQSVKDVKRLSEDEVQGELKKAMPENHVKDVQHPRLDSGKVRMNVRQRR